MPLKIIIYTIYFVYSIVLFFEVLRTDKNENNLFISIWALITGILGLHRAINNKTKLSDLEAGLSHTNKLRAYVVGVTGIFCAIMFFIDYLKHI